jgi:hypothetical protein
VYFIRYWAPAAEARVGVDTAFSRRAGRRRGPKYSEKMPQTPSTPEMQDLMTRMAGNFDLFIAHEIRQIGAYAPDFDALRNFPTRIVSAAAEKLRRANGP